MKNMLIAAAVLFMCTGALFAQDAAEEGTGFDFGMQLEIGAQVFNETEDGAPAQVVYQMLILKPEIIFGKFGIGLNLPFHYRFLDDGFDFRDEDWVVQDEETAADKYLPVFQYIRYGHKGDPLYAKLGSISDGTLGNGFIMKNYSNTLMLPERRIFGASFDLDGSLFNFPYIGIESFVGNLAAFDVLGGRFYARPIYALDIPVIKNLEFGVTYAMDRIPDYLYDFQYFPDPSQVSMFGVDFQQPLLSNSAIDLALFGDVVFQNGNRGIMVGTGGRFIKIIPWTVQVRFQGENFVPEYFDASYDLYREYKYLVYDDTYTIEAYNSWFASTGVSLLGDMVIFNVGMEGPLGETGDTDPYPQLNAALAVKEGVLPGVFFDASYEKLELEDIDDLVSPENSVIGARVHYRAGNAVITLSYDLKYNPSPEPGEDEWQTTTNLSTSISF